MYISTRISCRDAVICRYNTFYNRLSVPCMCSDGPMLITFRTHCTMYMNVLHGLYRSIGILSFMQLQHITATQTHKPNSLLFNLNSPSYNVLESWIRPDRSIRKFDATLHKTTAQYVWVYVCVRMLYRAPWSRNFIAMYCTEHYGSLHCVISRGFYVFVIFVVAVKFVKY